MEQAATEDNSPQEESPLDPIMKEEPGLDESEGVDPAAEESPDQSISSAMPIDSGVGDGDGAPMVQDGMLIFFIYDSNTHIQVFKLLNF